MKPIVFIIDGLHLSYGYFRTHDFYSHIEIERGYNIFGEPLENKRKIYDQYRTLVNGDGIKTFKSQDEINKFLSQFENYKLYSADLIHRKFYKDRDTFFELSV